VPGCKVVQATAQPLLGRLDRVAEGAGQAEAALRRVVLWASCSAGVWRRSPVWWCWGGWRAVLWWDAGAIGAAQVREVELAAEIAQLEAVRDGWEKAGMLGKLERCGPKARPCVRVDESAGGFGDRSDYRVILGY